MVLASANAATIYDNSGNDLAIRFEPGTLEVGDEINFGGSSLDRVLTQFSFEYFGESATPGVFAGNVQARVRFYYNNGTPDSGYLSPNTKFYDSQWFNIQPTYSVDPLLDGRSTLIFTAGSDNIPANGLMLPYKMTWSVQFQGMLAGDRVGIDLYDPPLVGTSQDDYWQFDGTAWQLKENPAGPVNFASRFDAVPEPSALSLLAGAFVMALLRRR